jgi:uncharacterized repeat protein (TIGR01451 family)
MNTPKKSPPPNSCFNRHFIAGCLLILTFLMYPLAAVRGQTAVDHFAWSSLPASAQEGNPFQASLQALDSAGNAVANFNGPVTLSELVPNPNPTVLITEVQANSGQAVELSNLSGNSVDVSGWKIVFYDNASWPAPKTTFVVPTGTICPSGGVFQVACGGSFPGSYPTFMTGIGMSWSVALSTPIAVLLVDASGSPVDFFCSGRTAYPGMISQPTSINNNVWSGPPDIVSSVLLVQSFQRTGFLNHHNAADWILSNNTIGVINPGLSIPFKSGYTISPTQPSLVYLTNGSWSGQITAATAATNAVLRADDNAGHSGDSAPLLITRRAALALQVPHAAFKATPGLVGQGSVSVPQPLTNDLAVTLSSSLPLEIAVPASVTIPAGQTNALFNITNFNDGLVTGPLAATILASATGWDEASDIITNYDQSGPALTVSLPSFVTENAIVSGTIVSSKPATQPVRIQLSANQPGRLQVPEYVVLPAGQTSVAFNIIAPDNNRLDGEVSATISASVPGWTSGQGTIQVRDNEIFGLTVSTPTAVMAGSGTNAYTGTVSIRGILSSNLVINLSNTVPAKLLLPETVSIPAGQTNATFYLNVPDDTLNDGNQSVLITASAAGFFSGIQSVVVFDNGVSHFAVDPISAVQVAGQPFTLTVYAQNLSSMVLGNYSGNVNLSASGASGSIPIQPTVVGPFTNGVWSGPVTISTVTTGAVITVSDSLGHTGASNPFEIMTARGLNLPVSDFVYDPVHQKILAGVLGTSTSNRQSIISIDPITGSIGSSVGLGTDPGRLALSRDSQFLYAAKAGTGGIARLNVGLGAIDLQFPLGANNEGGSITDMAVPPGDPHALVAWRTLSTGRGMALYRDGVQSPSVVPPGSYANDYYNLVFHESATNFYMVANGAHTLAWMNITSNGPVVIKGVTGYTERYIYENGLIFSTTGDVYEPGNFQRLGKYPANGWVATDFSAGRVYFLSGSVIKVCDLATFNPVGEINLPIASGSALKLESCGPGVLAVTTATQLLLIQSDLLPSPPKTDLSVSQSSSSDPAIAGSNLTYSITVSNAGPLAITNAILEDLLPVDSVLVSASNSQGSGSLTNGILRCNLGNLTPGSSETTTITIQAQTPGTMVNNAWVVGDRINLANGTSRLTNNVVFGSALPAVTRLWFNANSVAFDANRNTLWASVDRFANSLQQSLCSVSLSNGLPQSVLPVGYPLGGIRMSSDRNYLYAGYVNNADGLNYTPDNYIKRLNLASNTFDEDFLVADAYNQEHAAIDMIGISSYPSGLLVSRGGPQNDLALYQNGVAISRAPTDTGTGSLEVNPSIPTRAYLMTGNFNSVLDKLDVGPSAITVVASAPLFALPSTPDTVFANTIHFGAGRLFADNGMVVDPEAMTNITRLPVAGLVQTDPVSGLVLYLVQNGSKWELMAFDMNTLSPAWASVVPGVSGSPKFLEKCGPGILALGTSDDQLFILNTAVMPHILQSDLSLTETVSTSTVLTNQSVTFTTVIQNAGPSAAIGVIITNQLPPDAMVLSITSSQGTFTNLSNNITCSVGNLPAGGTATLQIIATLPHAGTITNLAGVVQSIPDSIVTNNVASAVAQFTTIPVSDLSLTQFGPAVPPAPGSNFACTLVVSNSGPDTATGVQLTSSVVSGATTVSATSSQGTVSLSSGAVTASLGSMANGATATVTLTLSPASSGWVLNGAQVGGDNFDPNPADNQGLAGFSLLNTNGQNLVEEIPFSAVDMAYDPAHQVIVASTRTNEPFANSILGINALDGKLSFQVPVTNQLGRVAVSDDGQYAYAGMMDIGGIARVNLQTRTNDLRFALNTPDAPYGPFVAEDLAVMPGAPETLVAARGGYGGYSSAVAVFDTGIQRPGTIDNLISGATYFRLRIASANQVYTTEPLGFRIGDISASGITDHGTHFSNYSGEFAVDSGLVFLANGNVFDPNTGDLVATFPSASFVAPDLANNRVYQLMSEDYGNYYYHTVIVRAFDWTTRKEIWSIPFTTFIGYESQFIKLGTNGLAFTTDAGRMFLVRSPQLTQPQTDVSIQVTTPPTSPLILSNGTASYKFTVVNSGPWTATGVTVSNQVPAGASFVSASSSTGTCVYTNGAVICTLGTMTNRAAATVSVTLQPTAVGTLSSSAVVTMNEPDLNVLNNTATVQTTINPIPIPPTVSIADATVLKSPTLSPISFAISLSGPSSVPISVGYQTADGTAIAGANYNAASGVVTFSPGQTNKQLTLSIIRGNTLVESNRYFFMNLTGFTNVQPARTQAVATILETNFNFVRITGTNIVKGTSGITNAVFKLTLSSSNPAPVSVQYQTLGGNAVPGRDYSARAGTIVFPANTTNATISVPVFGSTLFQSNTTFYVLLSQPVNAVLGVDQAQATIINSIPLPPAAILDFQVQGTNAIISFNTVLDRTYRIERTFELGSGNWSPVVDHLSGNGQQMQISDPINPSASAYYRLVQLP